MTTAEPGSIPAAPPGSPFHSLLTALSLESRIRLLAASQTVPVAPGEVAIEAGQHVDHLAVILTGTFRVESPDRHGLPVEIATLAPGDYFGEMSFLGGDRASATVRAIDGGQVLELPHATLAEVAASDAGLTRELARVVATRVSLASERFRAMRPGRVVACVLDDSPHARLALYRVAESAARHARAPVLVIDPAGAPPFLACEALPGLDAVADPGALAAFTSFAARHEPHVGRGDLAGVRGSQLADAVSRLQRHFPLILIAGTDARPATFDGPFHFLGEGASAPEGGSIVLLETGRERPRPARLARLSARYGRPVVAALTGGAGALEGEAPWPGQEEPWRSIDGIARRLLRRTVGLALGAGGAKGYAHVGVIRALRTLGVPIDYLAGCSIGAPLAAGVAVGLGPRALRRELDTTFRRALRPVLPIRSFLSTRRMIAEMDRLAAGRTFDDIDIPLALVAVDLDRREEVVLTSGPSDRVLAASMAIPGIFAPVEIDGRRLIDGGLLNPVPTSVAASLGADIVIGVKLTDPPRSPRPLRRRRLRPGLPPIVDSIVTAIDIMQWKITADGASGADITIHPVFAGPVGLRDFHRAEELIAAGEKATFAALPQMQRLLPWVGR